MNNDHFNQDAYSCKRAMFLSLRALRKYTIRGSYCSYRFFYRSLVKDTRRAIKELEEFSKPRRTERQMRIDQLKLQQQIRDLRESHGEYVSGLMQNIHDVVYS